MQITHWKLFDCTCVSLAFQNTNTNVKVWRTRQPSAGNHDTQLS